MKNLLILALSLICMNIAYADNFAKLRVKISGATSDNRYFLCVGSTRCVSIEAGDKGQSFPMSAGPVNHVYASDITTLLISDQTLPKSCKVTVNTDQTLVVTGRVMTERKGNNVGVRIEDLNCHVA